MGEGWSGNRPDPPRWKALRKRVLARDRHRCTKCGSTERLECDHVDGDHTNNAIANLAILCHDCHKIKSQREAAKARSAARRLARRPPEQFGPGLAHPGLLP